MPTTARRDPRDQTRARRSSRPPREAARATGPALEACYQLILWLVPTIEKFPRSQKFLLGDRLHGQALAVSDDLIKATFVPRERALCLRSANLALERMRFSVRIAKDLGHLDFSHYEYAARAIDEVGRLVGGWIRVNDSHEVTNVADGVSADAQALQPPV